VDRVPPLLPREGEKLEPPELRVGEYPDLDPPELPREGV
jgi:hypothetical protein